MNRFFILILSLLLTVNASGQNLITGKVVDAGTGDPLAFANIIFNNDQFMGARSDIDGKFSRRKSGKQSYP